MTDKTRTGGDLNAVVAVAEAAFERAKDLSETRPPPGAVVSLHDVILDSERLVEDARVGARAADDIRRERHRNREFFSDRLHTEAVNKAVAAGLLADAAADELAREIKRLKKEDK
jgi:hypothetical protein